MYSENYDGGGKCFVDEIKKTVRKTMTRLFTANRYQRYKVLVLLVHLYSAQYICYLDLLPVQPVVGARRVVEVLVHQSTCSRKVVPFFVFEIQDPPKLSHTRYDKHTIANK